MTDRSNDPEGDPIPAPEGETDAGGEAAGDLDELELEAAAAAAESQTRDSGPLTPAKTPVLASVSPRPEGAAAPPKPSQGRTSARTPIVVDPSLRIRDRASAVFVALSVVVFVAIFANAMLFGVGGALNPLPTVAPAVSVAPSGSAAASPTASPTTRPTSQPTPTAAPSAT